MKGKGLRKIMTVCLALILVLSMAAAAYGATITLSTDSVRLKVSYPGASASHTVTVRSSTNVWGVSITSKPSSSASGVSVHQNRMSSFTIMAAANATPGTWKATVSSGGTKKTVTITVIRL